MHSPHTPEPDHSAMPEDDAEAERELAGIEQQLARWDAEEAHGPLTLEQATLRDHAPLIAAAMQDEAGDPLFDGGGYAE